MSEDTNTTNHSEALAMLDTFASVGATRFDVTRTNAAGNKVSFERGVPRSRLAHTLPAMIDHAIARRLNVIVRPAGAGISFLQLDDLKADRTLPSDDHRVVVGWNQDGRTAGGDFAGDCFAVVACAIV